MRLDKFLTECGLGSRREVKNLIDSKKYLLMEILKFLQKII